jgi:hypothetical protein
MSGTNSIAHKVSELVLEDSQCQPLLAQLCNTTHLVSGILEFYFRKHAHELGSYIKFAVAVSRRYSVMKGSGATTGNVKLEFLLL